MNMFFLEVAMCEKCRTGLRTGGGGGAVSFAGVVSTPLHAMAFSNKS